MQLSPKHALGAILALKDGLEIAPGSKVILHSVPILFHTFTI